MTFSCIEMEGILYQPEIPFQLNNFFAIPATNDSLVSEYDNQKIILISEDKIKGTYFIFCYQFLFSMSTVYYNCSLPGKPRFFEENGDINDIVKKYKLDGGFKINFNEIDTFYTGLPDKIKFEKFFNDFVIEYEKNGGFKNIIDLFLYAIGHNSTFGTGHKFYDNIFQKITQLQTIFETITGNPEEEMCLVCERNKYTESWEDFLTKKLGSIGITDQNEIDLIIKIKTLLNKESRVKYVHNSAQLDIRRKIWEDIKNNNNHYLKDFLNEALKTKEWSALD